MLPQLTRQQKIAYGIVAALALILVGLFIYIQVTGGGPFGTPGDQVGGLRGLSPQAADEPLNVNVLKDPRYLDIDKSLFDQGRVPVPVPPVRGKPNLF